MHCLPENNMTVQDFFFSLSLFWYLIVCRLFHGILGVRITIFKFSFSFFIPHLLSLSVPHHSRIKLDEMMECFVFTIQVIGTCLYRACWENSSVIWPSLSHLTAESQKC